MADFVWEPLTPREAVELLEGISVPWWIAGGYALDLFVGHQTRSHGDLDVEMLRRDQLAVQRYLESWDLKLAANGALLPWPSGQEMEEGVNSVWGKPSEGSAWKLQIYFADSQADTWVYRRHSSITRPLDEIGLRTIDGLPYLAPEIQLLYKAKGADIPKNQADFEAVLPYLKPARKAWLSDALSKTHPDHPWLAVL